jgi:hypothetical protein
MERQPPGGVVMNQALLTQTRNVVAAIGGAHDFSRQRIESLIGVPLLHDPEAPSDELTYEAELASGPFARVELREPNARQDQGWRMVVLEVREGVELPMEGFDAAEIGLWPTSTPGSRRKEPSPTPGRRGTEHPVPVSSQEPPAPAGGLSPSDRKTCVTAPPAASVAGPGLPEQRLARARRAAPGHARPGQAAGGGRLRPAAAGSAAAGEPARRIAEIQRRAAGRRSDQPGGQDRLGPVRAGRAAHAGHGPAAGWRLLVLEVREGVSLPLEGFDKEQIGPRTDTNPDIPPEGTVTHSVERSGLTTRFQFTAKSHLLRLVVLERAGTPN